MPVDEEYDEALKSNFADMANVGPRAGGSITAAMFLKRFAGKYRWAHLDIAGTAFDNVVAYTEGQGAVALPETPDFFAFIGATQIELAIIAQPDNSAVADLSGKSRPGIALT
jgi:hypothetical protein